MACEMSIVSSTDDFEDLLDNMELDEGLLRELIEIMNDDNMAQTSVVDTMAVDMQYSLNDKKCDLSQLVLDDDKKMQDLDYWVSQNIVEMASTFPGLTFENEMTPFWHVENPVEDEGIDDIAYVELWEK